MDVQICDNDENSMWGIPQRWAKFAEELEYIQGHWIYQATTLLIAFWHIPTYAIIWMLWLYFIDGLVQKRSNSSALAMELLQSCPKSLIHESISYREWIYFKTS